VIASTKFMNTPAQSATNKDAQTAEFPISHDRLKLRRTEGRTRGDDGGSRERFGVAAATRSTASGAPLTVSGNSKRLGPKVLRNYE
jgi:hypothetical protein